MKYHVYIYDGSLVFSVCIYVFKNLYWFKTDFRWNKSLLENTQLSLSKGNNWIIKRNANTPQVRKASGIRMVKSLKVIFPYTFHKHRNTYPPNFQFRFHSGSLENAQISSSKPCINSYACTLTKITTSEKFNFTYNSKQLKKN